MTSNDERVRLYATAVSAATGSRWSRVVAHAVMAVANAEQDELREALAEVNLDIHHLERALAHERAKVERVEKLVEALTFMGNLPIEERPDGLTASVKACTAIAGDLRRALDGEPA